MNIEAIDAVLNNARWAPRHGWHDDHREHDRTPAYLPAMMQVRSEFAGLIEVLRAQGVLSGSCFQLGMGECNASHEVWRELFDYVCTIDFRIMAVDKTAVVPGGNTREPRILEWAHRMVLNPAGFDFLFIDAGHKMEDIRLDHEQYGNLVRPGGIIAFHDSLKRPGYEDEVDVWRYIETLQQPVHQIGSEVGIAWIVK